MKFSRARKSLKLSIWSYQPTARVVVVQSRARIVAIATAYTTMRAVIPVTTCQKHETA
nr:MAG TPA: hypothetical protein [Caudoviricetes sp.]